MITTNQLSYGVAVLVILPPSETKSDGGRGAPLDLDTLSFPELNPVRKQVADALVRHLDTQGVLVVVQAEHLCMSMRGIRKPGASTVTSAVRGQLRDPATRAEAMSLMLGGRS